MAVLESGRRLYIPHRRVRRIENMDPDDNVRSNLVDTALHMPERKVLLSFQSGDIVPKPLVDAMDIVRERFGISDIFDDVVLKMYEGPSDAYAWHMDPEKYWKDVWGNENRMVLWNLAGRASLSVMDTDNVPTVYDCLPDSATLAPATARHMVTPPDPAYGPRVLLWMGQRG